MAVGSNIQAVIYPIINDIPLSNHIGFSPIYTIQSNDTNSIIYFKITDTFLSRLKLDSGKYLIAINKYTNGSSLAVKMTNKYFSENAVFVKIGNANFQTLDTYYSGAYKLVPTIRMYCSPYCNLSGKIKDKKADCLSGLGSLSVTPKNGSFPYKYKWNNNSTDSILSNIKVGIYSVNIIDKFGCIFDTQKVELGYNNSPRITLDSIFHPTCYSSKNGYVSLNVVDTNRLTKIFWNKEQTNTIFHNNLASGTYTVKVYNEANCFDSTEVVLSAPDSLNISYVVDGETSKERGEIFLFVKGGVPPYTFSWNDTVFTKNRTDLDGDKTYSVEIKDANSCSKYLSFYVNKVVGVDRIIDEDIVIYPNPTTGIIRINLVDFSDLIIENSEGKYIDSFFLNEGTNELNMLNFEKGIYFLSFKSKNKILIKKIAII
jgi:hypothetical protein